VNKDTALPLVVTWLESSGRMNASLDEMCAYVRSQLGMSPCRSTLVKWLDGALVVHDNAKLHASRQADAAAAAVIAKLLTSPETSDNDDADDAHKSTTVAKARLPRSSTACTPSTAEVQQLGEPVVAYMQQSLGNQSRWLQQTVFVGYYTAEIWGQRQRGKKSDSSTRGRANPGAPVQRNAKGSLLVAFNHSGSLAARYVHDTPTKDDYADIVTRAAVAWQHQRMAEYKTSYPPLQPTFVLDYVPVAHSDALVETLKHVGATGLVMPSSCALSIKLTPLNEMLQHLKPRLVVAYEARQHEATLDMPHEQRLRKRSALLEWAFTLAWQSLVPELFETAAASLFLRTYAILPVRS
jgi:hypothetical protein